MIKLQLIMESCVEMVAVLLFLLIQIISIRVCYQYAQFVIRVSFASLHIDHRNPEKRTATPEPVPNRGIF